MYTMAAHQGLEADPASSLQVLSDAQLATLAGGFSLGSIWDGVKDVGALVEAHPFATLALVATAATGVGAAFDVAAVAGTDAAAIMGVSTSDLVAGAVGRTASMAVSSSAWAGMGDLVSKIV